MTPLRSNASGEILVFAAHMLQCVDECSACLLIAIHNLAVLIVHCGPSERLFRQIY